MKIKETIEATAPQKEARVEAGLRDLKHRAHIFVGSDKSPHRALARVEAATVSLALSAVRFTHALEKPEPCSCDYCAGSGDPYSGPSR